MQNKQKFQRATLVSVIGQPKSPSMTITKIIRTITGDDDESEKIITFAYECSWWNEKKRYFHREIFEEDTLQKVREKPV